MTSTYIILGLLVLAALFLYAKQKAKRGVGPLANKSGWYIEYSEGLPARPVSLTESGWVVNIPMQGQGFLGSVKQYSIPKMRVGGKWTLKCRVEGNGAIAREYPEKQATATFIVQRRGDNGLMPEYRWYSNQMVDLKDGSYEFVFPLTIDNMKPVMGKYTAEDFAAAINDAWNVQIGFGSAGGRAHSVHTISPSTFYMDSLTYSPT